MESVHLYYLINNPFLYPFRRRFEMLHYTVVFFVIAIIAAVFGFGGIASGATEIAKILFFVFLIVTVISFLMGRKG